MRCTSLLRSWSYDLTHASRGYWWAQSLALLIYLLGSLAMGGVLIVSAETPLRPGPLLWQTLYGTLLLGLEVHVGVRPPLRRGLASPRAWILFVIWLVLLATLHAMLEIGLSSWLPHNDWNPTQISFGSDANDHRIRLSQTAIGLVLTFNQFALLLLWSLLYLGWKAFEARRQLQQQVRQARLRQLAHQLSPHFLFNAFNTIRALIYQDRDRAATLVTELSELFRFHLSAELRIEQSLDEEWQTARRYLDLEAVRLESRLRQQIDLDPACLTRPLPVMTLLTLVENAVKHGIAPNPDGGWLRLRAWPQPQARRWHLQVVNSVGDGLAGHGTGSGLSNLRERMALQFGKDAVLRVDTPPGQFIVTLELPA